MGILDKIFGDGGKSAAAASREGAALAAQGDREKLDYLKEVEALPLELRNEFLPQYADIMRGGQGQQDLITSAEQSPLYAAIMGGQAVGEDAIMRNASMTGGLRSGNVSADLTDYGSQLSNQALLQSYDQQLQGIQGLANMPLNTNAIGNAIAAPNQTLAQGNIAAANALQQGQQSRSNMFLGLGGAALMAPAGTFSDIRLKENIVQIGRKNGIDLFTWDWNKEAEQFGLTGEGSGVMAHLVAETHPHLISEKDGYIAVNYEALGMTAE